MHGIKNKTDIGFLTINEFFRYIEVGSNYKNPNYPIWLIYFNKSYYVIFGWTFQVIREGNIIIFNRLIDANLKEFDLVLIA